jgi:phosphoglycolate phosphatase
MLRELNEAARALAAPRVVLFDWHATLVDTLDAMYHAVDDVLERFDELGLIDQLIPRDECKTHEDSRLVDYVREHQRLHPKIKAARRISRTDIFEVLFGYNEAAKQVAHAAFNEAYRNHYGEARPFEGGEQDLLIEMREFAVRLGILTNRDREFFEKELAIVDGGAWVDLFETTVCGCDTGKRKPNPEPIFKALENLGAEPDPDCWYIGDSTTDVIAAKRAGITSVFFKLIEECLEVGHNWRRSDA